MAGIACYIIIYVIHNYICQFSMFVQCVNFHRIYFLPSTSRHYIVACFFNGFFSMQRSQSMYTTNFLAFAKENFILCFYSPICVTYHVLISRR